MIECAWDAQEAREGGDQVGRLLDGMDDVEPARRHTPHRFREERQVEDELARGGARPDAPHGEGQAATMAQAGHVDIRALGIGEKQDVVTLVHERAHHGQHGQGRAADLEEGLRGQEQDAQPRPLPRGEDGPGGHAVSGASEESGSQSSVTCSPRKRSASMAAMQPLPAAVTACR